MNRAAQLLWENDIGALPVVADDGSNRLVGIVTDRDICMAVYTQGKTLGDLLVDQAMSRDVRGCSPITTLGGGRSRAGRGPGAPAPGRGRVAPTPRNVVARRSRTRGSAKTIGEGRHCGVRARGEDARSDRKAAIGVGHAAW